MRMKSNGEWRERIFLFIRGEGENNINNSKRLILLNQECRQGCCLFTQEKLPYLINFWGRGSWSERCWGWRVSEAVKPSRSLQSWGWRELEAGDTTSCIKHLGSEKFGIWGNIGSNNDAAHFVFAYAKWTHLEFFGNIGSRGAAHC